MKYDDKSVIAIFDSGFGGISVLNNLLTMLPDENYLYFADSSNFPYGTKSKDKLIQIGDTALSRIYKYNPKSIVIACNTMSTSNMAHFKEKFSDTHIVGTYPSFYHILKHGLKIMEKDIRYDKDSGISVNNERLKVLIICTTATSKSSFMTNMLKESKGIIDVCVEPADFIARAVEKNETDSFYFKNELESLFKGYKDIDHLVLGCTHFPFVTDKIREILGYNVNITSSCEVSAKESFDYIVKNNLMYKSEKPYIRIIDDNICDDRKKLYNTLIKNSSIKNIIFN